MSFEEWMDEGHQELAHATGSPVIYKPFDSKDVRTTAVFVEDFGSIQDSGLGESNIDTAVVAISRSNGEDEIKNPTDKDQVEIDGRLHAVQRIQKVTAGRVIARIVRHQRQDVSAQGSKTRRF